MSAIKCVRSCGPHRQWGYPTGAARVSSPLALRSAAPPSACPGMPGTRCRNSVCSEADPSSANSYWYASDDPINQGDPTGPFSNPFGAIAGWAKCKACEEFVGGANLGAKVRDKGCEPAFFAVCMALTLAIGAVGGHFAGESQCHHLAYTACSALPAHELGNPHAVCRIRG